MTNSILEKILKAQGIDVRDIDLPIDEGSLEIVVGDIDWSDQERTYSVIDLRRPNGGVSLIKNKANELVFTHTMGMKERWIKADVSNLAILEKHHLVITWSKDTLALYVNEKQVASGG